MTAYLSQSGIRLNVLGTVRKVVARVLKGSPRLLNTVRIASIAIWKNRAIESWPPLLAELHEIKVPRAIVPNPTKTPRGSANINILFKLLEETKNIEGDVAECGVFRGATLIPMGLYLKQHGIRKTLLGFDSFEGFDQSVNIDIQMGGGDYDDMKIGGFGATSYELVTNKVARFGLSSTVKLVKGYFRDTLPQYSNRRLSLVHLDCDIYQSYKECLEFFYPRLNPGGLVLFDEYNDPPWPGCNKAVDEFLADKPERLLEIETDNYQKWYFRKQ